MIYTIMVWPIHIVVRRVARARKREKTQRADWHRPRLMAIRHCLLSLQHMNLDPVFLVCEDVIFLQLEIVSR